MVNMPKKIVPFILLLLMALVTIWLRTCNGRQSTAKETPKSGAARTEQYSGRGFNRQVNGLEYTRHARCRMQCRHITQAEVMDIIKNGRINYRKTDVNDRPCPTYALEGYTQDQQHVRIVFAQCQQVTKVVTCIDLESEVKCDCE
jgi:hypothetical protein